MSKRYRLLKDLPDVFAGAIFEIGKATDAYYLTSDKTETKFNCYIYPVSFVETHPDWFAPIPDNQEFTPDILGEAICFLKAFVFLTEKGLGTSHTREDAKKVIEYYEQSFPPSTAAEKETNPDWEVLKVEHKGAISFWSSGRGYTMEELGKDGWNIYQVKRLSDSTTWSVGEEIVWDASCNLSYPTSKIESFEIRGNQMWINVSSGGGIDLIYAEKLPSPQADKPVTNQNEAKAIRWWDCLHKDIRIGLSTKHKLYLPLSVNEVINIYNSEHEKELEKPVLFTTEDISETIQQEMHIAIDYMMSKGVKASYQDCVTVFLINKIAELHSKINNQ